MLVVAADDGIAAQSREPVAILGLLRVPGLVVAISRAEGVETEWLEKVEAEIGAELADTTFGAAPLAIVDSIDGRGLGDFRRVLRDRLAVVPRPVTTEDGRLWVDRAFPAAGAGTVVTGTLSDGGLARGVEAHVMPSGERVRVRRLQSLGENVVASLSGSRVAVNLVGIDHHAITRSDVLVAGPPPRTTTTIDVLLRTLPGGRIDGRGSYRLHVGTVASPCTVRPLGTAVTEEGAVPLTLPDPLTLRVGDCFVLRDGGRRATTAGVVVVDTPPARLRGAGAREPHAARVVVAARASSVAQRLVALLKIGEGSRSVEMLRSMLGVDPVPHVAAIDATVVGGTVVAATRLEAWSTAACTIGHGVHPRDTVSALARAAGAPDAAAADLPDHLVAVGVPSRTTIGVALPDEVDTAAEARDARAAVVIDALLVDPFRPAPLADCLRAAGLDHRERTAILASGRIVRSHDVHFAADAVEQAVALPDHLVRARVTRVTRVDGERHHFVV